MTSGRKPKGKEPINIAAATKVNASEKAELLARYGTMYSALRAGIKLILDKK